MEIIYKCLTGSHCQGLNRETSDKDWKCLALPTPEEIVRTKQRCKQVHHDNGEDYDIHDLRDFTELMRKSNPTYLEILWPAKVEVPQFDLGMELNDYFFKNRDRIAAMNTTALWHALDGMYNNRMERIYDKPGDKGYNGKNACHALRCTCMTIQFANNDFRDFGECVCLPSGQREILMMVKNEEMTKENVESLLQTQRDAMLSHKEKYVSKPFDNETYNEIRDFIDKFVWNNVRTKEW